MLLKYKTGKQFSKFWSFSTEVYMQNESFSLNQHNTCKTRTQLPQGITKMNAEWTDLKRTLHTNIEIMQSKANCFGGTNLKISKAVIFGLENKRKHDEEGMERDLSSSRHLHPCFIAVPQLVKGWEAVKILQREPVVEQADIKGLRSVGDEQCCVQHHDRVHSIHPSYSTWHFEASVSHKL